MKGNLMSFEEQMNQSRLDEQQAKANKTKTERTKIRCGIAMDFVKTAMVVISGGVAAYVALKKLKPAAE